MKDIAKYIIIGVIVAILAIVLWYFKHIVAYILISAVLSLIGRPLVDFLNKVKIREFHFPKALSAAITLILLWTLFISFFRVFVPLIVGQAEELSTIDVQAVIISLEGPLQKLEDYFRKLNLETGGTTSLKEFVSAKLLSLLNLTLLTNIISSTASFLGNTFIAFFATSFITFFFLKDERLFVNGVILLVPTKYEEGVHHVLSSIKRLLMRYFIGILCQITGIIILITTGLSIVGLEFHTALVIALMIGLLNVIPYLGPYMGGFLGILLGIANNLDMEFYSQMLPMIGYMLIVFVSVQVVDNTLFQPLIYGTSVMAHPLEIFLVILIAASLAGIIGMILAIPTYTVLRVIAKEFFNRFKVVKKLTEKFD
jgi:predicted PurR-regulated permease PerM